MKLLAGTFELGFDLVNYKNNLTDCSWIIVENFLYYVHGHVKAKEEDSYWFALLKDVEFVLKFAVPDYDWWLEGRFEDMFNELEAIRLKYGATAILLVFEDPRLVLTRPLVSVMESHQLPFLVELNETMLRQYDYLGSVLDACLYAVVRTSNLFTYDMKVLSNTILPQVSTKYVNSVDQTSKQIIKYLRHVNPGKLLLSLATSGTKLSTHGGQVCKVESIERKGLMYHRMLTALNPGCALRAGFFNGQTYMIIDENDNYLYMDCRNTVFKKLDLFRKDLLGGVVVENLAHDLQPNHPKSILQTVLRFFSEELRSLPSMSHRHTTSRNVVEDEAKPQEETSNTRLEQNEDIFEMD
jgi:hypothetical protein